MFLSLEWNQATFGGLPHPVNKYGSLVLGPFQPKRGGT